MDLYFELLKKPVFTPEDVISLCGKEGAARMALYRLLRKGLVLKIRNGLYTAYSGETLSPVANRWQIASKVTASSFLSYHSAMEYHGNYEQVSHEVMVSSLTSFRDFSFDGYHFRHLKTDFLEGVIEPPFGGGVRVTDSERTLLDALFGLNKNIGAEETMKFIDGLYSLNEGKLLAYLPLYRNKFLYQKAGFFLYPYRERLSLSESFFAICEKEMGRSKRYLTGSKGHLNERWGLIVPSNLRDYEEDHDYDESI